MSYILRQVAEVVVAQLAVTGLGEEQQAPFAADEAGRVAALLGGDRVFKHKLRGPLDAHELLLAGLPGETLSQLERRLQVLSTADIEKAIGMSLRTLQRRRADPGQKLSVEQGGRIWKFAEILLKAGDVMGGQKDGEEWLGEPAMALNGYKPLDLLTTAAGTDMVETLLGQIEYGVYV